VTDSVSPYNLEQTSTGSVKSLQKCLSEFSGGQSLRGSCLRCKISGGDCADLCAGFQVATWLTHTQTDRQLLTS